MKQRIYFTCIILLLPILIFSQGKILLNAWAEAELSHASANSHYYFNEIHENNIGWHTGMNNINALVNAKLNAKFSVNLRAQFSRYKGEVFNQFRLPLANIKYTNEEKNFSLSLGRSITAFGSFSSLQHPKERTFINLPLAYSYFLNISSAFGFNEMMGQSDFLVNDNVDWGTTLIYYGAYSDGLLLDWNIKPDKVNLKFAITNHASNIFNGKKVKLKNYGFNSRLQLQPTLFWEQGISLSHGSFFQKMYGEINFENLNLKQTMIGTDFKLGFGFWEISGELLGSLYSVPIFGFPSIEIEEEKKLLGTYSARLNVKYELPVLSGLYLAYGFEYLSFSKYDRFNLDEAQKWDEDIYRHQLALGYKITDFLLLRSNYMLQPFRDASINSRESAMLSTWRSSLTLFF